MSESLTSAADAAKAQKAILNAGIGLYEVAGLIRAATGVTEHEVATVLLPAMEQVQRIVLRKLAEARAPAIEKPKPSIIQNGPDKAADFLRAVAGGAEYVVADSATINAQIDRESRVSQR